jgi:hypothetical protein
VTRERQLALITYQLNQAASLLLEAKTSVLAVKNAYDLESIQGMSTDILIAATSIQRGIEAAPAAPPVPPPHRPRQ